MERNTTLISGKCISGSESESERRYTKRDGGEEEEGLGNRDLDTEEGTLNFQSRVFLSVMEGKKRKDLETRIWMGRRVLLAERTGKGSYGGG